MSKPVNTVLLVHNYYGKNAPSGEDVVFEEEKEMLEKRGIRVLVYARSMEEAGRLRLVKGAFSIAWSTSAYNDIRRILTTEKCDVAHFHNIFPFISPSAYFACKEAGVPVIQTLHNYRMICANGMLLDKDGVCEKCLKDRSFVRAVIKGCYRGSRVASVPVVVMQYFYRNRWNSLVDQFIALTEFGKNKHVESGLIANKVMVKPNFLAGDLQPTYRHNGKIIFVGRLKYEKGIDVLAGAIKNITDLKIDVFGEGPLRNLLESCWSPRQEVVVHGMQSHEKCVDAIRESEFMVNTSICYEGFPKTIAEAFCLGKPVVAPNFGAMSEIVVDNYNGLLYRPGDCLDLAKKMKRLLSDQDEVKRMGVNARRTYEEYYCENINFNRLLEIYKQAIK